MFLLLEPCSCVVLGIKTELMRRGREMRVTVQKERGSTGQENSAVPGKRKRKEEKG